MDIKMFDIYAADLPVDGGSAQTGRRPVLVISNEMNNKYAPTVIILPLSSNIKKENQPTHTVIRRDDCNNLKVDSMVLAEQVRVIDKTLLKGKIGSVQEGKERNDIVSCYIANVTGRRVATY